MESRWTEVDGLTMHARVSANPMAEQAANVVLVHGMGISSRYFLPTAELLAGKFRVFAPDMPGFGLSDKADRVPGVMEQAEWLHAWMGAYGLEDAGFMGNSFGCQVVAEFAVRYPERVNCTVMVGPTTDPRGNSVREQLRRWRENDPHEPPAKRYICWRDYLDCGPRALGVSFLESMRHRIEGTLPKVEASTLVVRGSLDPIVPQRWGEEACRLLPRGELAVVPGAYHTVNFSSPLELVRVAGPFLGRHCRYQGKPVNQVTQSTSMIA